MFKKGLIFLFAAGVLSMNLFGIKTQANDSDFAKGLKKINDTTYMHYDSNNISVGWKYDYHFNNSSPSRYGYMDCGWFVDNTGTYFLSTAIGDEFGKKVKNWQWIDGYCYYFDVNGRLVFNYNTQGEESRTNEKGQWMKNGVIQYSAGKGYVSDILSTQSSASTDSSKSVAGYLNYGSGSASNYVSPPAETTAGNSAKFANDILIIETKSNVASSYVSGVVANHGGKIEKTYEAISTYKIKFSNIDSSSKMIEIKNALQSDANFSNVYLDMISNLNP